MNSEELLSKSLDLIVADNHIHARWLNTLSLMENTGARKISYGEHPMRVDLVVLKHAAEEARHAYYLKKQISKFNENDCPDYSPEYLLAPFASYHYLHKLDVAICRYLKEKLQLPKEELRYGSYIMVTYAVEMRADMLYAIYQQKLDAVASKVNVKSIIAEEDAHLEEMTRLMKSFHPEWERIAGEVCALEQDLFHEWMSALSDQLFVRQAQK